MAKHGDKSKDLASLVGDRLPESWRAAFTATPRELFIPDQALWVRGGDVKTPIDRGADPDTWRRAVYSDDVIITQIDDGATDGEGDSTSSASMPSVMLTMLTALDVEQGGTGCWRSVPAPATTPRCWRTSWVLRMW
jgi:protein-L-isoaspartate O-methyltransferase